MDAAVRPYRDADAPAVAALMEEAARIDTTLTPAPLPKWRRFVSLSFNRGGRDFLVAEDAEGLVALTTSARMEDAVRHFRVLVHPRARRRGIGTAMLRSVETQDTPPATLQCNCLGAWEAGRAFLGKEGFTVFRRLLEMERAAPGPPLVVPPEGTRIRAYRGPADDAAWRRLHDLGYRGEPDYGALTPSDLQAYREADGFFLRFAERDGEPCGLVHVYRWDRNPWINSVVVAPDWRGRGLGRALVAAALRDHAGETVVLSVLADNVPALAVYRGLGFRTRAETFTFRRCRNRGGAGQAPRGSR